MFLGVTADVANFDSENKVNLLVKHKQAFSLILNENPLSDFVVLPMRSSYT